MSARMVITARQFATKIDVIEAEAELDNVCPGCLKQYPDSKFHSCTLCIKCCDCRACRGCGELLTLSGCTACGLCRTCCKCWACVNCNAPHTHRTAVCDLCGRGKPDVGCGCCRHNRVSGGVGHCSASVNLDRYRATEARYKTRNQSTRLVAAEMEICGVRDRTNAPRITEALQNWHGAIVGDGSLPAGGFEINTHPASGDFWLAQIEDICEALMQARAFVGPEAGCHTHVDAQDLGYLGLSRLLRLCACTEAAMMQMIPVFRRTSTYCAYWTPNYLYRIHGADEDLTDEQNDRKRMVTHRRAILGCLYGDHRKEKVAAVRRSKGAGPRYRAVNVHSWFYRGTIEFRMPIGTIYATNVINWGLMLANLVDLAVYRSQDEIVAITKDVEKLIKDESYYNKSLMNSPKLIEPSIALLKQLAPTPEVKDWIAERIQWAKRFTTSYEESY